MGKLAQLVIGLAVSAVSACIYDTAATANITIGNPTNHVHSIALTGCAPVSGTSTLNPDPITYLAAAAAGGLLDTTFTADAPTQFNGWTLGFAGAALAGNLAVTTYSATNLGGCTGGAAMNATYTPGAGDPGGLTYLQVFMSGFSGTHIDPFPSVGGQPLYYTPAERARFGLNFMDDPEIGPLPQSYTNTTMFYTYLVTFNTAAMTVTAYDGFQWGYTVRTTDTPEPSTWALFLVGLLGLGLAPRSRGFMIGRGHSRSRA